MAATPSPPPSPRDIMPAELQSLDNKQQAQDRAADYAAQLSPALFARPSAAE
jgi:hypothetical protein